MESCEIATTSFPGVMFIVFRRFHHVMVIVLRNFHDVMVIVLTHLYGVMVIVLTIFQDATIFLGVMYTVHHGIL
jgi:hypothetical protein